MPGTPMRGLVFRSHALDEPNAAITRALVVVHGGGRDAEENLRHAQAAAFLAGALDDTVIVSPRFASNASLAAALFTGEDAVAAARSPARDALAANELNWVSQFGPRHWNAGGVAANATVTSYEVIDEILKKLARKSAFPNLKAIVVAGHSSGGQFVSRYHMVNRVHESLMGVKLSYVISNPGAYTYLDALRPTASAWPDSLSSAMPGYIAQSPAQAQPSFASYADARNCVAFDTWPYGLKTRAGYAAQSSDDQLKQQVVSRPATYVFGELDVLPLVNFDISCSAMAQGASRLARGLAYTRYLRERFAARHAVVVVPGCGHHTRCMLTSDPSLPLLFPKEQD